MKVLLVAPAIEGAYTGVPVPPLGVAYIASSLEGDGHSVKIVDMDALRLKIDDLLAITGEYKPDSVGFSVLTPFYKTVCVFASKIKKLFDIPIFIGGAHPSGLPEGSLQECPNIDIAVIGEGEETVRELISAIDEGRGLHETKGIAYREGDKIVRNPPRELIEDIDSVPFPAWHLLPMERYLNSGFKFNKKSFSLITSRGCPYKCTYCDSHQIWKRKLRYRSPENILMEIRELKEKYGVSHIILQDDTFTASKSRVADLCDRMIKEAPGIVWDCKGRVDRVDFEVLKKMRDAGCTYISYGLESGSQEILDYVKKGITIDQIRRAVKLTKHAGIEVGGFWMMGFPPEDRRHIDMTVELLKELNLGWNSGLSILVPYPGTDIYADMKKEGLVLNENWDYYFKVPPSLIEPPIRTRHLSSRELFEIKRKKDREIMQSTYKAVIMKHVLRLDKTALSFLANPGDFLKSLRRFVSSGVSKIRSGHHIDDKPPVLVD